MKTPVRLTQFSSGAGCGCKISPQVLDRILSAAGAGAPDDRLLVGNDHRDDAAAYALDDGGTALLATTDFFMPIVDDPEQFGRIAAANAISDIYAMGGRPVLALAVLGWPLEKLPAEVAGEVLAGARMVCSEAGIALAGGHSIDSEEPIFGLAVNGLVPRRHLKTNAGARPGDLLFLTKPLGSGVIPTALKKGAAPVDVIARAVDLMATLNRGAAEAMALADVIAATDVTGFGLLGHGLELARGSGLTAFIEFSKLPVLPDVVDLAQAGFVTGASGRNWMSYGQGVELFADCADWQKAILTDPQTSGGLLVACSADAADRVLEVFRKEGFERAAVIGRLEAGEPLAVVKP
ncbi:MAG: selenide, water dikinase SelD [Verrucomicrobiae bacterium]|nr:selenide, water dikinase SelD [Verrucomicrobiae bacterium]